MRNVAHSAARHNFAPFRPSVLVILLRKMPPAFSAALFEQIFALWREVVVYLRRAAATREDAEKRALKSAQLGLPTGIHFNGITYSCRHHHYAYLNLCISGYCFAKMYYVRFRLCCMGLRPVPSDQNQKNS